MTAIKRKDIITDDAIEAPLDLGKNFEFAKKEGDQLLETLLKIADTGKIVDKNLDVAKSTKAVSTETGKLAKSQTELEKIDKRIATAQERQNKEFIQKEKLLKDIKVESKRLLQEEEKLLGTEEKLIKANKDLLKERRKINTETEEGAARVEEINAQMDENTESIKGNVSQQEKLRFQVGDYRNQLEGLTVQLFEASQQKGGIKSLFLATVQGIGSATKAGLKFIATPVGAVLAAIVAGIAALTLVINNNQEAGDKFAEIWGGITNIFDEVLSRLVKLSSAFLKFVSGDLEGAFEDASAAIDNFAGSMKNAFNAGRNLVRLQIELEKATILATTATAKLEGQIELLQIRSDDATRSFKEREDAAEAVRKKEFQLAQINLDLAAKELEIINLRVKAAVRRGSINRVLQQEQADALAEFIRTDNEALASELNNEVIRSQLKQDRLEKDLDILIDGFDNVKTINERIINDDKRTIRNRQEGLDQLVKLGTDSYNKQIETIKQFTQVSFDENELINEQDAVALNNRIRNLGLSEIIEGRLLEVIRERRIVLADTAEIEETLQQAQITRLNEIAGNEKNITDQRIQALLELGDLRLSILDDQLAKGIVNEQEFSDKVEEIHTELAEKIADLQLRRFDTEFTDAQLDAETERINKLIDLNEQFRNGEIESFDEFEKRKLEIQAEAQRESLNEQLDFLEERKKLLENSGIDTSEIDKNIAEVRLKLSEVTNEEILDNEGKLQDALRELRDVTFAAAQELINRSRTAEDEKRADEIEKLEIQKESRIAIAGDDAQARAFIEEDFARKKQRIDREQAQANRRRAIFDKGIALANATINIAAAISEAVALAPATGGLPFSAIAAAIGAIQIGLIASQPIPSFFGGTDDAPGGLANVHERGSELIVTPDGGLHYDKSSKPSIVNLPKHSKVFTAKETEDILAGRISMNGVGSTGSGSDNRLLDALHENGDRFERAIKGIPQDIYDEKGYRHYQSTKNGKILSLNKRHKLGSEG